MLVPSVLSAALAPTFAGVDTFAQAGDGWASAYTTYAQGATAGASLPVFTGLEQAALSSALAAAFANGVASEGASLLAEMEVAFQSFWLVPPIPFAPGAVSLAPPGLAALIGATYPANLVAATGAEAAVNVAAALDTWTRTVMVTFPNGTTATLL